MTDVRKTAGTELEVYETALLMWFYGMDGNQVRAEEWTAEEIKNAEDYAELKQIDVMAWEEEAYGR